MNVHPIYLARTAHVRAAALGVAAVIGLAACSSAASPGGASSGSASASATGAASGAMVGMAGMAGMADGPVTAPSAGAVAPPAPAGSALVGIVNFSFTPARVTVKVGQAIQWTNRDAVAHTVDFSGDTSKVLNRGDTYTKTFARPGVYPYICSIHPFMHGTVTVTA
jgi:plastocyanin